MEEPTKEKIGELIDQLTRKIIKGPTPSCVRVSTPTCPTGFELPSDHPRVVATVRKPSEFGNYRTTHRLNAGDSVDLDGKRITVGESGIYEITNGRVEKLGPFSEEPSSTHVSEIIDSKLIARVVGIDFAKGQDYTATLPGRIQRIEVDDSIEFDDHVEPEPFVETTSGAPCPDCAHTENPGVYVGFAFEREACRTCSGSATVSELRTYKIDRFDLSFNGIKVKPYTGPESIQAKAIRDAHTLATPETLSRVAEVRRKLAAWLDENG